MYVVLPVKADGLTELAARVDSSTLSRARITMELAEIKVSLPKFRFENSVRLNDALKSVRFAVLPNLFGFFSQSEFDGSVLKYLF